MVVGSNDGGNGGDVVAWLFGHGQEMIGSIELMLFAYNGCVVQLDEHSHILMSSIVRFGVQPLMFVLFLTIMFPWNSSGISMEFAFIPWNQEWIAPIPHGMQWNPYGINHCMTIP
jgi:hypothetical protein